MLSRFNKLCPLLGSLIITLPFLLAFDHIPQGANEQILQDAALGQKLIFQRRYDQAQKHFIGLRQKYPDSPLGSFGLMALYNTIMFENYDFTLDQAFDQESRNNKILVDKIAEDPNADAWSSFLCGASSGLRGFYLMRNDQALKALGEASTAKKCLERALEKDPKFQDANLGLGLYYYWRSVFTNRIKILPFFKDQRKEGIALLKKAEQEGIIANDLTRAAMMFVLLQEGQSRAGLATAQVLDKKYPGNVIVLNHMGRFLANMGKRKEAIQVFQKVQQQYPKITVATYFEGDLYYRMGKYKLAKDKLSTYLKTNPSPAWQAYTHYRLGYIALREKDRKTAMDHFKQGHRVYGDYKPNLKMVLKMRKGDV